MTKIYLVETNAGRLVISDNGDFCRVLDDSACPAMYDMPADEFLASITDDSGWDVCYHHVYDDNGVQWDAGYASIDELLAGCEKIIASAEVDW